MADINGHAETEIIPAGTRFRARGKTEIRDEHGCWVDVEFDADFIAVEDRKPRPHMGELLHGGKVQPVKLHSGQICLECTGYLGPNPVIVEVYDD
ncbi:MAG: hypothetical protein GY700_06590 [Propionibacteriaceae bacterium]|nr:hypothetical protein [Propionibacteriaceae bacterium]